MDMYSKMVWENRQEPGTEEDRLIERFTRRETPEARGRRIARRRVDPAPAAALERLWAP